MIDIEALTAPIRDGFVPAHIYNDEAIFRYEVERLFAVGLGVPRARVRDPATRTTSSSATSWTIRSWSPVTATARST